MSDHRHRFTARPTLYRGTLMRSRLEASAAGELDEMGIPWKYEPVCFADGADQYLPDFQLWPGSDPARYLEVKPESVWSDWPPKPGELLTALNRMRIIHASDPHAALMLWMPSLDCSCGGHLASWWPGLPEEGEDWELAGGREYLSQLAAHERGEHAYAEGA